MTHSTHRCRCLCLLLLAIIFTAPAAVDADVTVPQFFGNHMVLQRDKPVKLWGWADKGEKVTVALGEAQQETTADDDGRWSVHFPARPASREPVAITIQGKDYSLAFDDVLFGDVWICSGQSNMEWPVTRTNDAKKEIAAADHPTMRLFTVKRSKQETPQRDVSGSWGVCSPETVPGFSAVGYFFGRHLQEHVDVPIGLINSSWGGTPAEYWTPTSAFEHDPQLKVTSDNEHAKNVMSTPSVLYNGMIAPIAGLSIRGAIWYQGESNVPMAEHYTKLFSGMIKGWREEFGQGEFPFLFVQIAPWDYRKIAAWPAGGAPIVREAQRNTLAVPKTGMVVTTDIGNVEDIHPTNKQEVGRRLGLAARAIEYGEKIVYSGPMFKSVKFDGNKAILSFDHLGGGLMAKGDKLTHFQIAGEDGKFVDAEAVIEGETVVVKSTEVPTPQAVRFGFSDVAEPNLFNKDGLPASPFRTDD
ncbi:sialate O-acetylesterase [Symmachiella dynata]|mgnify:CR=1 FL=1|uniref:sialate O-acetylesterase n=1 Tax=Symmachiella dynata TaxID=2527995 RepID=UPI0030EF4B83